MRVHSWPFAFIEVIVYLVVVFIEAAAFVSRCNRPAPVGLNLRHHSHSTFPNQGIHASFSS